MSKTALANIYTIVWKEWKEILGIRKTNNTSRAFVYLLLIVGILGVLMPLPPKNMEEFISNSFSLMYFWSIIPYFLIFFYRQYGILEERQHKTLLTLIATKTPDYAIVLGKIIATTVFCWSSTMLASIFSIIKANLLSREGFPFFYDWKPLFFGSCISLLFAILIATCGMLISFYTHTAVKFQLQYAVVSFLLLLLVCLSINTLIYKIAYVQQFIGIKNVSLTLSCFTYLFNFALIDLFLLILTLKRFKRERLILS